jgi:hypothetical protein
MGKKYCVYLHYVTGSETPFYVGCGTKDRSINFKQRNYLWLEVYFGCDKNIVVKYHGWYDIKEEAMKVEHDLIVRYGMLILSSGPLTNISPGLNMLPRKKVSQYDKYGNYIKTWDDIYAPQKEIGASFKAISYSIARGGMCKGFQWRYSDETNSIGEVVLNNSEKVIQYSMFGEIIKEHESMAAAAKETNTDRGSINNCVLGVRISAGGFIWVAVNDPSNINVIYTLFLKYNLNGGLEKIYKDVKSAANDLGISSTNALRNCITGKQKKAYGHKWAQISMPLKTLINPEAKEKGWSLTR